MELVQYGRELPVEHAFDIIVVGGGPSGVVAAIGAGRLGRKVVLIEQLGCLGGLGTSGLVNVFMPFGDGERTLMRGIGAFSGTASQQAAKCDSLPCLTQALDE